MAAACTVVRLNDSFVRILAHGKLSDLVVVRGFCASSHGFGGDAKIGAEGKASSNSGTALAKRVNLAREEAEAWLAFREPVRIFSACCPASEFGRELTQSLKSLLTKMTAPWWPLCRRYTHLVLVPDLQAALKQIHPGARLLLVEIDLLCIVPRLDPDESHQLQQALNKMGPVLDARIAPPGATLSQSALNALTALSPSAPNTPGAPLARSALDSLAAVPPSALDTLAAVAPPSA